MTEYTWETTTDEVLQGKDLTGKRILVTGVSAGLGVETARALAAHGAEVIGAARNLAKAAEATRQISAEHGDRFRLVELDLASLDSVRACADALLSEGKPIDVIIANAGIMAVPFARTADGFESQMGVNHLAHFVLINRLAPLLPEGGRVVSVSSVGHHWGDVDLDDVNFETTEYDPIKAYGRAKTANILFAVEFDRRHKDRGVRAIALHPGGIITELTRSMSEKAIQDMTDLTASEMEESGEGVNLKSVPQGAATSVWAATAPIEEVAGRYCEDCNVSPVTDSGLLGARPYAMDPDRARALWTKSEEWAGERF